MFVELNTKEMIAKLPPRRRASIKKAVAKSVAIIEARLVTREVKVRTGSASASMSAEHAEMMVNVPAKAREDIEKKAAKEIARLRAEAAKGNASSASPAGMPMAAAAVGK